jgi:hypothetical protein
MKRAKTPTFLLELPLQVDWSQERRVRAHLEAARCLYNALLEEANKRLRRMRNDPAWTAARALPRANKQERAQAFAALRKKHHFSEYELHEYAKGARVSWIADHIDSTMAQTLASRAYQAVNRVCVGKAKRVRFRSRGRGIDSVEGKRNDVGMRFVLDPNAGDGGFLLWNEQVIPAIIDWRDPVVQHALRHPIKYVRLVRRKTSSAHAQGADGDGNRYFVQVALEGHAFVKPKHEVSKTDTIGLDIGPSTLAIVPRDGKADLLTDLVRSYAPTLEKNDNCSARWNDNDVPTTPTTSTKKGGSKNTRRAVCTGARASGTRRPGGSTPTLSADSLHIARVCTGSWHIASRSWAPRSKLRRPHSKDGKSSMVGAWDFAHQGCL